MWCVVRQRRLKREVQTTRLGHKCLRACGSDMGAAMVLYSKLQTLRHQFPDMKLETVWFALHGGRRSLRDAQTILEDALAIRSGEDPFVPSMTEALERAEARHWTRVNELLPWLHWLILHEARDRANFAVAVNAVRSAFTGHVTDLVSPYVHLAVSTRWKDPHVQSWAVAEMVKQLPPDFLRASYVPRPLSHRVRAGGGAVVGPC